MHKEILFLKMIKEQAGKDFRVLIALCVVSGLAQGLSIFFVLSGLQEFSDGGVTFHTFLGFLFFLAVFAVTFRRSLRLSSVCALRAVTCLRERLAIKLRAVSVGAFESRDPTEIRAAFLRGQEMVVEAARSVTAASSNTVMMIIAFIKMATISVSGMLVVVAILGVALYFLASFLGRISDFLSKGQEHENAFGAAVGELTSALVQLKLNKPKTAAFYQEVVLPELRACAAEQEKAENKYADGLSVFAAFQLTILGFLLFLSPKLLGLDAKTVTDLLVLTMFCLTPLMSLVSFAPMFSKVEGILQGLNRLEQFFDEAAEDFEKPDIASGWTRPLKDIPVFSDLSVRGLSFDYPSEKGASKFGIDVDDFYLKQGELVFIKGGNGSGKSTFMRVLCGIYTPDRGEMVLNGRPLYDFGTEAYRNLFTILPTDYHLFDRPFGLDVTAQEWSDVIEKLRIETKISLTEDGRFSTLSLSAGQKKRVALAVALLEKRPVCLFDEVAADFDPAFRSYFYRELLPELKNEGRTILAISHDDRYFDVADRVLMMREGRFCND